MPRSTRSLRGSPMTLVDEDGEELPDGDQYERLMLAAHDVVDAADRPIGDDA